MKYDLKLFGLTISRNQENVTFNEEVDVLNERTSRDDNSLAEMSTGNLWELIGSVRQARDNRINKYSDYEEMCKDPVVNSAMELICDDATQFDDESNHVAWVISDNKELEAELNAFLHQVVDVDTRSWSWAFDIVKYGETFLRTYATNEEVADRWIFEQVRNPQGVSHIVEYGEEIGYVYDEPTERDTNITEIPMAEDRLSKVIFPPEEFIHFISDRSNNRADIQLKTPNGQQRKYKVVYGSSFIEAARPAYQIVRLLEDVLVLARIARSTMYRLVKVEVGNRDPKQTKRAIDEVKNAIKKRQYLDLGANMYKSEDNPVAVNDNIYIPVRNGIGDVDIVPIGEDVNVNSIVDIDYFKNKLFAALKVPKAFLGFEDQMPAGLGSSSLTRVDVRYARTVKRIQSVLRTGYKALCNYYLDRTGQSQYKMNYEIKTSKIISSEENARTQELFSRVNVANSMFSLFSNPDIQQFIDPAKYVSYVMDKVLGVDFSLFAIDPKLATLANDPTDPPSDPINPVAGFADDSVDTNADNSYNIATRYWNFGDPY